MTFFGADIFTAIAAAASALATVILAIFAIVTAKYARKAFEKQSQEVSDQAEMLDLQRKQLAEQEKTSAKQAEVLGLQAKELQGSLEERGREAEERRRGQAARVTAWFGPETTGGGLWGAWIRNGSDLPVLDVRASFYFIQETQPGSHWEPVFRGSVDPVRVMPPQADRFIEIPSSTMRMLDKCDDSVYAVSITFTDAAGNKWERDPRGALNPSS